MRSSGISTPRVKRALAAGLPVLSVDTKKKELVGNYANAGRQWRPARQAPRVQGHDFPESRRPARVPVRHLRRGPQRGLCERGDGPRHGRLRGRVHPRLVAGGRPAPVPAGPDDRHHGGCGREQRLAPAAVEVGAAEVGRRDGAGAVVCHFPPGTSKWNKVEHRLFSFISSNWRGEPLRDYETIVHLIARTTTAKGLQVICRLDRRKYRDRATNLGRGDEEHQPRAQSLPRGLELRHQTASHRSPQDLIPLFVNAALQRRRRPGIPARDSVTLSCVGHVSAQGRCSRRLR